jgi:hypothetical protein
MICRQLEIIPVKYTKNNKLLTISQAINQTLKDLGGRKFVKIKEINDNLYIIVEK